MNHKKAVKVIFVGDAKEEYRDLNRIVGEEISKGIKTSDKRQADLVELCKAKG